MIKLLPILLLPIVSGAIPLESIRADSERAFSRETLVLPFIPAPITLKLHKPLRPRSPRFGESAGPEIARIALPPLLDRNLHLMSLPFGREDLDVGVAADTGFGKFFMVFSDSASATLAPLGNIGQLTQQGAVIRINDQTVYKLTLSINIFGPSRNSTLHLFPIAGTVGPRHDIKTGKVLDAAHDHAFLILIGGREYWFYYGRDVLPGGKGLADACSFLFVRENGLSSETWPLPESSIKPGESVFVVMDGNKISLTRTLTGELVIRGAS